jgi:hypothetical protein
MGTYFWLEVNIFLNFRLIRKRLWPTDYEKVMATVNRKPIANNLFQDSFMMG